MKSTFQIDLKEKNGKFRLQLIELLIKHYDFIIIDETCFFKVNNEDLEEYYIENYYEIGPFIYDVVAGEKYVVFEILNFKKIYETLCPFIEQKIRLLDSIFEFEQEYEDFVENNQKYN